MPRSAGCVSTVTAAICRRLCSDSRSPRTRLYLPEQQRRCGRWRRSGSCLAEDVRSCAERILCDRRASGGPAGSAPAWSSNPEGRARRRLFSPKKSGRHHADHLENRARSRGFPHCDRSPKNCRIPAESALPVGVAEHATGLAPGAWSSAVSQSTAQIRRCAEDVEVVSGDHLHIGQLRLAAVDIDPQASVVGYERQDSGENLIPGGGDWTPNDQAASINGSASPPPTRVAYIPPRSRLESERTDCKRSARGSLELKSPPLRNLICLPFSMTGKGAGPRPREARDLGSVRRYRTAFAGLAASLLLVFAVSTAWYFWPSGPDYKTPIGGTASSPWQMAPRSPLNTDSAIRVAVTEREREVQLDHGEAFFEVAKDPKRPFVVSVRQENASSQSEPNSQSVASTTTSNRRD